MAGHYFKTKEERMQAFYNCILALWGRAKAGKDLNPSVVIDRFHIGHIKMEPILRLAKQDERPTFEQCVAVRNELCEYQKQANKRSREKKKKNENINGYEIPLFKDDILTLLKNDPKGEEIAATFLKQRNWKLQKPTWVNY